MDLGNKTANNLISKDFKVAKEAASSIINTSDTKAFGALVSKSEFIFDYIKEKIVKNLTNSVNETNVIKLFDFMNIYSEDFCGFILNPLLKFKNEEIENKFFNLLKNGSETEKTYALIFFTKNKDKNCVQYAKENLNSGFYPLKSAAIKLLSEYLETEDFNLNLEILKNGKDDFEKIEAVEFLTIYGDKCAFNPIYDYFLTQYSENVAQNLLFLKSFKELMEENKEDIILKLYASILRSFPEDIQFTEIEFYIQDGVFDFLVESDKNFSVLLNFYLKNKLDLILNNEAYLIDLSKDEQKEAKLLFEKLSILLECFDLNETIEISLNSKEKIEILIALEIIKEENIFSDSIKTLCNDSLDNEIILECLKILKQKGRLEDSFLEKIQSKIENKTIKAEIKNL